MSGLIERSAGRLSQGYYTAEQIAAAITHVFGVDSELVADGTYFVAESAGALVGCGGWSRRATLFGGDAFVGRSSALLDPATDAARIRAFFVDPAAARGGVATRLLAACEAATAAADFRHLALMATLPGVPFYRAAGFVPGDRIEHDAGGVAVPFVTMTKQLRGRSASAVATRDEDERERT